MALLWNAIKEAARAAKGQMSKNTRNAAKAEAKKERGPVKAFFHITKNENVPAIEQQGLVANNPNANMNSAYQPFASVGVKGGGNWVTDQPSAFPVYGTTVGGKRGNGNARRDALTTFKIELPVSKLPTMRAVRDPYGNAKLTTADKGLAPFGTWADTDVNTMAILEDIPPEYLKNIGYVEELNPHLQTRPTAPEIRWEPRENLDPEIYGRDRDLSKADRAAVSMVTGHDRGAALDDAYRDPDYARSPARFVDDYMSHNRPITERLPEFPRKLSPEYMARYQGQSMGPKYIDMRGTIDPVEVKRYSMDVIPASDWSVYYRDYVPFGSKPSEIDRTFYFEPGAISRGIGGVKLPPVRDRVFNWNTYRDAVAKGATPYNAALKARPKAALDWDNIVYTSGTYQPAVRDFDINPPMLNLGSISRGEVANIDNFMSKKIRAKREANANRLRNYLDRYIESNRGIIEGEYHMSIPDDELRELAKLELSLAKYNGIPQQVQQWASRSTPESLKLRQRALDRIKGSWLYDYLTK